jgi:hypothetical protein
MFEVASVTKSLLFAPCLMLERGLQFTRRRFAFRQWRLISHLLNQKASSAEASDEAA